MLCTSSGKKRYNENGGSVLFQNVGSRFRVYAVSIKNTTIWIFIHIKTSDLVETSASYISRNCSVNSL
jgi:hypothetical protein